MDLYEAYKKKIIKTDWHAYWIAKEFEWDGEFKLDKTKPDGVPEKKVDPNLGERILGWLPEVSIDEGIKLTVEWFIENEKNIT